MTRFKIEPEAARRFLARRFGDRAVLGFELPRGEWSHAYALTLDRRDHVIRFNPSRDAFDVDLLAMRFAASALPIPSVVEVGEAPECFFAISERVFGSFLEDLAAAESEETLPSLFEALDCMRRADTSWSTGFGPWGSAGDGIYSSWRNYLVAVENEVPQDRDQSWRARLRASASATAAFNDGVEALQRGIESCPEIRHVIHSDLINRNVFVKDGRVSGLIDWQCAMYGDFLYELAWFTFWAPWHPGLESVNFKRRCLERLADEKDFAVRMRCYEIHIGLRHLVYNAWRGDSKNLEATARRTVDVIGHRNA